MGLSHDSNILIQLYEDLLRKYPFSIIGRPDAENELAKFFSNFCRHPIVKDRRNIVFIIALYAELESLKLENLALEHVINWRTKPLKNLLLFNYEGEYPDLILSFYLTFLAHISGKPDITATNIIADSVRSDVDLRIVFTQFRKPSIHFIEREDVIEFRTPHNIFREELWDEKDGCLKTGEVRRILQKRLPPNDQVESRLIARAVREEPHVFEIDRKKRNAFEETDASGKVTSPVIDKIFNLDKLKETVESYFDEFARLSKRVLVAKLKESDSVKNLTWIAIGGAFLAAYYNINLDYILSVCNVSGKENFTLGGLAIGSKRSTPLSSSERALFSIVSDHISANLSAQMAHDLFTKQFLKGKAPYVLLKFTNQQAFRTLTHLKTDNEQTSQLAQAAYDGYLGYDVRKVLSGATADKVTGYLNKLRKPSEIDAAEYENVRRGYEEIKNALRFSARELWEHLDSLGATFRQDGIQFVLEPVDPNESNLSNASIYADYDWIKIVIGMALKNSCREKNKAFDSTQFDGTPQINIEIFFLDDQKVPCLTIPEKGASVLHCVIQDNGIGCNVHEIPSRGGSYGLFFQRTDDGQKYGEVLNAHGNLTIESGSSQLSFLEPDEKPPGDFDDSKRRPGTRVTLMLNVVSYG